MSNQKWNFQVCKAGGYVDNRSNQKDNEQEMLYPIGIKVNESSTPKKDELLLPAGMKLQEGK